MEKNIGIGFLIIKRWVENETNFGGIIAQVIGSVFAFFQFARMGCMG